jgi:gliding motility-associated-like protein
MFTHHRILLFSLALLFTSSVFAQEQIERLFRSDRQNASIDVAQTSDMGYLIFSAGRSLDSIRFEYYTVSKFDNKGNFSWSKDYDFEQKVLPDGSLTLLPDGGFIISGVLDTSSINKVLLRGDINGEPLWTRAYGQDDPNIPPALRGDAPTDENDFGNLFLSGTVFGNPLERNVFLAEIDTSGNQLWGKSYNLDLLDLVATSVKTTQDSGAIICGTASTALTDDIFVIKTDSLGEIEWSRQYGETDLVEKGTSILPTTDGGYLIGASKVNPILPSHPGFLIKTDTFGNSQWILNVDFQTSDTVLINDMIMANDGNVVVSGSLLGINDETFAWMMKISLEGDMIWKRRYKATTRQNVLANELIESEMGGYVYITSSDEGTMQAGPYLIKTLEDGTTICDSIIDGQLIFPVDSVQIDTLILTTADVNDTLDITLQDTLNYGGFQLVTVQLETFGPYCPDEIFMDTLDATTDGAVAYEWESGETTPFIVVTEPGEYMVTVTIGEDYCYNLCTSSTISENPFPTVMLDFDDGTFCTTGTVTVLTDGDAIDSYEWSTGETESNIIVDTEGLYAVTVTNQCGTDEDEINITFDTSAPNVDIAVQGNFCTDGSELLTAETSFPVNGFLWSTGDETISTTVDALGTYTVTALSNFCDPNTAEYTATPTPLTVSIARDSGLCFTGTEVLSANTSASTFLWSTGDTSPNIQVSTEGDYSVTVSDFCSEESADISVTCPLIFELPNLFTPDERETDNDIFIPIFAFDPSTLVEYEFKVFSRWGEVVFETNSPTQGWDGTVNDEIAPSDTYFYTIKGENSLGVSIVRSSGKENHGDITLFR